MRNALVYFDPRCLSKEDTEISLHIKVSPDGLPKFEVISNKNGTAADVFYCEQAIWEASPIKPVPPGQDFFGTDFMLTYRKGIDPRVFCLSSWPELVGTGRLDHKIVALHVIPASFGSYFGVMGNAFINRGKHTLMLRIDRLNDKRLDQFRKDWIEFGKQSTFFSEDALEAKAKAMRQKYADFFEKTNLSDDELRD